MRRFDHLHQGIARETPSSIEGVEVGSGNSVKLVEIIDGCGGKKRTDGLGCLSLVWSRTQLIRGGCAECKGQEQSSRDEEGLISGHHIRSNKN
jgi:hypothetical protein